MNIQLADPEVFEGAPCTRVDPDIFFTDGTGSKARYDQERAKAICRHCPDQTRLACESERLALAGENPSAATYGVWGGVGPADRSDT